MGQRVEGVNYLFGNKVDFWTDFLLRPGIPPVFEDEEVKARCPDCSQPLTFVRTRSHQKKWYCYSCEKYVDHVAETRFSKDAYTRLETLNGLQVIDSHGMIVGRVRKAISSEAGDIRSLILSVDKEQFKNLLDEKDLPREYEIGHEKIATVGDVVILSDVFSLAALGVSRASEEVQGTRKCWKCSSPILLGAKHCIICGSAVNLGNCASCGTANPIEAKFCKNCGNRIT